MLKCNMSFPVLAHSQHLFVAHSHLKFKYIEVNITPHVQILHHRCNRDTQYICKSYNRQIPGPNIRLHGHTGSHVFSNLSQTQH